MANQDIAAAGKATQFKKGKVRNPKITPELIGRRYDRLLYRWMGFAIRQGESIDPKVLQTIMQAAGDRCKALGQIQPPAPPESSNGKDDAVDAAVRAAVEAQKAKKGVASPPKET